jgi:uncharacterized membrane protein (DUF4010 family)
MLPSTARYNDASHARVIAVQYIEIQKVFLHLGAALAVGLLIGLERGWKQRDESEGSRVAGVRTFALLGLLGGVCALLAGQLGVLVLGLAFLAVAAAATTAYALNLQRTSDASITSLVAGLLTFALGAVAGLGEVEVAVGFAVVATLLLGFKPQLHHWVKALEGKELRAVLQLSLISLVLLPLLPNRGYGPWEALNPYEIWWMVVLIAGISFVGYFAIKIAGARKGVLYTGLFGGLASSTALTLNFARAAHYEKASAPLLAVGVLVACATMYPRMLLVAALINAQMLQPLLLPVVVMAVMVYGMALYYWWRSGQKQHTAMGTPFKNPLELKSAAGFGVLLALITLLGRALKVWLGTTGILVLAAASGVADVDAITLSLSRMSQDDISPQVAVTAIVIAAAVNNLVKGGIALVVGGRQLGMRVALPLLFASLAGLLIVWPLV